MVQAPAEAAEARAELRKRVELLLNVPPSCATFVDQIGGLMRLLAEAMKERFGRRFDAPADQLIKLRLYEAVWTLLCVPWLWR